MLIPVTAKLGIDDSDLDESFITASGPGGQNVNKVATAVQLRFNLRACGSLPESMKTRIQALAGRRLNQDGVIVITANRFRTQSQNREDARKRLLEMLRAAAVAPIVRQPTRPTKASKTRRLAAKTRRATSLRERHAAEEPD